MHFVFFVILSDIFFSLAYFIVKIQYIMHIQNMCSSTVHVIDKLPVNSRLLVVKFLGSRSYMRVFDHARVSLLFEGQLQFNGTWEYPSCSS